MSKTKYPNSNYLKEYFLATDKVTEIMIHEIFSQPVASRIFAYPNVVAYVIIASYNEKYNSLRWIFNELTPIPVFDKSKEL